eukprot:5482326-Pyramimonas_sp.AAC.1
MQPWIEDLSQYDTGVPSFITWNARALLHHLPAIRKKKCRRLAALMKPHTMIGLQEVHGTEEELRHEVYLTHRKAAVFASVPRHNAGGVALLLPGFFQQEADEAVEAGRLRHTVIVPGYVQRLQVKARASHSNGTRTQDSML